MWSTPEPTSKARCTRGSIGSLFIIEEMNALRSRLQACWRTQLEEPGEPQKSPAVEVIEEASFLGRQFKTNLVMIGQFLSAGSGESHESVGIRLLGRAKHKV
jgi:hypothetical protein